MATKTAKNRTLEELTVPGSDDHRFETSSLLPLVDSFCLLVPPHTPQTMDGRVGDSSGRLVRAVMKGDRLPAKFPDQVPPARDCETAADQEV